MPPRVRQFRLLGQDTAPRHGGIPAPAGGSILKTLPVPAEAHTYVVMEEVKETLVLQMDR